MSKNMETADLYPSILRRSSIRRYDQHPLDASILERIAHFIQHTRPLIRENNFSAVFRDGMLIDRDFITSMGAYGYIVSPPHALAPYLLGDRFPLIDLGYRVEQIVIQLTRWGIGSCYIGTLSREESIRTRLGLPTDSRCGALLVFGYPAGTIQGRMLNALFRSVPRGNSRLPERQVFFQESFNNPSEPPGLLKPILTAARFAPSAVNAQPWRFLWKDPSLYMFVTRLNPKYGRGPSQDYRLYDGGICMANITMALDAQEIQTDWILLDTNVDKIPDHPSDLEPLALLTMP
jgi:nitroreductase